MYIIYYTSTTDVTNLWKLQVDKKFNNGIISKIDVVNNGFAARFTVYLQLAKVVL